jgi:predicted enzyme related to lactoylglutathione lyase
MDITIHASFLPQDDPDAALAFYRDTLGFEVRNDVGYRGMRWITVGPPGQPGTSIVLHPPGADPGVTDDERRTIVEMMAKGTYDLEKAKTMYTALLGVAPQADGPYYVGFEAAGQQIGLVPGGGPQGMTSPVAYWHVADIEAKLAEVTAAGATVKEPAHDVGGGRLVATVTDPDGNVLGLLQDR